MIPFQVFLPSFWWELRNFSGTVLEKWIFDQNKLLMKSSYANGGLQLNCALVNNFFKGTIIQIWKSRYMFGYI